MNTFEELNAYLRQACLQDAQRRTRGQKELVAQLWEAEKAFLLHLPARDFLACATRVVKPNGYLQVDYEANRYSVPYDYRDRQLVLRAFPFRIEFLYLDEVIASHVRCFQKELVAQLWEAEKTFLLPLPARDFPACNIREVAYFQ